jgi:DNA-binding CsgD family transcriptional regulator
LTTLGGQVAIRTRVDGGIGSIDVGHLGRANLYAIHRQALDAVVAHIRNPEVQTIAVADFDTAIVAVSPDGKSVQHDPELLELCQEVAQLLLSSSKTLVVRRTDRYSAASHPVAYVEPLTARERQVLAMACDGASAREIADQLFISERTVETHVSNGYRKLGINSRVELVRRAAEFDL